MQRASKTFQLIDNLLYFAPQNKPPTVALPECNLRDVLEFYHDNPLSGHRGVETTIKRISQNYYYPRLRKVVREYIRKCLICQKSKSENKPPAGLMQASETKEIHDQWSIDIMGPLPTTSKGHAYILVCVNTFSKYAEIRALKKVTASAVVQAFLDMVICCHGVPKEIVSDHGPQFVSNIWSRTCDLLGIRHKLITVYRPQSNRTERHNKEIKLLLSAYVQENHDTWDQYIPQITFALNTASNVSTKFTPFLVTFGREARAPCFPTDILKPATARSPEPSEAFTTSLVHTLQKTAALVRKHNRLASERQKSHYDRGRRNIEYRVGQLVLVKANPRSNAEMSTTAKFHFKYDGPFLIAEKLSPLNYKLSDPTSNTLLGIRHADQLKPFYGETCEQSIAGATQEEVAATEPTTPQASSNHPSDSQETVIYDPETAVDATPVCALQPCTNEAATDYVCCDRCDRWYHTDCVNLTLTQAREQDFICELC